MKEIIKAYRRLKKLDSISEGNLSGIEYSRFNSLFASLGDPELGVFKFNVQKFREVLAGGEHSQREIFQNLVPIIDLYLQQRKVDPQIGEWRETLAREVSESIQFINGHAVLDGFRLSNLVKDRSYRLLGIDDGGNDFRIFERQRVKQLLDGYPDLENLEITLNPENGNLFFQYRGSDGIKSQVDLYDSKSRFTFIPGENALVRLSSGIAPTTPELPNIEEEIEPEGVPCPIPRRESDRPTYRPWGLKEILVESAADLLGRIFNGR